MRPFDPQVAQKKMAEMSKALWGGGKLASCDNNILGLKHVALAVGGRKQISFCKHVALAVGDVAEGNMD